MADLPTFAHAAELELDDRSLDRRLQEMQMYCRKYLEYLPPSPQLCYLESSLAGSYFGYAVAISADGLTMAVSAPWQKIGDVAGVGIVHVYRQVRLVWQYAFEINLPEADIGANAAFGFSLALNKTGDTLVVGCPGLAPNRSGAAYIFSLGDKAAILSQRFENNGRSAQFGSAVSMSADAKTIAVSSPELTSERGLVKIFEHDGIQWTEITEFRWDAGDTPINHRWFGFSLSLAADGQTLAIGAPYHGDETPPAPGSVYIHRRKNGVWNSVPEKIKGTRTGGQFGIRVTLNAGGDLLAVAEFQKINGTTPCFVNLYRYVNGKWEHLQELTDLVVDGNIQGYGSLFRMFCCSIAFGSNGKVLVVGTRNGAYLPGTSYLYINDGKKWTLNEKWSGDGNDGLGSAVAISADSGWVAAAAPLHDRDGKNDAGAVNIYGRLTPEIDQMFGSPEALQIMARSYASPELADGNMLPHQAFLLAYMRMLETPRRQLNALPFAHRQLYYRDLLGLKERAVAPDHVAVSVQLDKSVSQLPLGVGTLLDAGQDQDGNARQYALVQPLLANQSQPTDFRWSRPLQEGEPRRIARVVQDHAQDIVWPASGVRLFDQEAAEVPEAPGDVPGKTYFIDTGRVVGSPMLAMSGGTRELTVTFAAPVTPGDIAASISGAEGWVLLALADAGSADKESATVIFQLTADAPATTPPNGLDGFHDDVALLRLLCRDGTGVPNIETLKVRVLQADVVYGTDEGVADTDGPSTPFRFEPVVGAGINLVAADWCNKPYDITVKMTPHWEDLPGTSFKSWYAGYPAGSIPTNDNEFTVASAVVTRMSHVIGASTPLFVSNTGTAAPKSNTVEVSFKNLSAEPTDSGEPKDWHAWIRLELDKKDFLHQQYPAVAGEANINPPYTPQWNRLDVEYSTAATAPTQQYLLTDFGYHDADQPSQSAGRSSEDEEGAWQLYLGFAGINVGQDLSLYWQLRSPAPQSLAWEYLSRSNQWKSLSATVKDSTGKLFYSGKWTCVLPADAATEAERGNAVQMPAGRAWLRARFDVSSQASAALVANADGDKLLSHPTITGLHTNAAIAVLHVPELTAASHFLVPLPPYTISQAVDSIDGLAQVIQPWPSFDGRAAELPADFNGRAASRLENRRRMLTWRDVGVLLKEEFPEVHDIRIPTAIVPVSRTFVHSEQWSLVVIPEHGKADNVDPFRPRFDPSRLARMRDYLNRMGSAWCELEPDNPVYTNVHIDYQIEFVSRTNPDYGHRLLKGALRRHYMPWSEAGGGVAVPGYHLDYYDLVAFIQRQPQVQMVKSLTLTLGVEPANAKPRLHAGDDRSIQARSNEVLILMWSST